MTSAPVPLAEQPTAQQIARDIIAAALRAACVERDDEDAHIAVIEPFLEAGIVAALQQHERAMAALREPSPDAEVKIWNLTCPVGTPIAYTDDFGRQTPTTTRSAAQVLSGHTAVIWIDGKSGCVALKRCAAMPPANTEKTGG